MSDKRTSGSSSYDYEPLEISTAKATTVGKPTTATIVDSSGSKASADRSERSVTASIESSSTYELVKSSGNNARAGRLARGGASSK